MNAFNTQIHNALTVADGVGGLTSSAVLLDLTISTWVGRKMDKKNTDKVVSENNATARDAANVTKKLFVGNKLLEDIMTRANAARNYVADKTLPWMGDLRLLPMTSFLPVMEELQRLRDEHQAAVDAFLRDYDLQVAAMAFKLGKLFDRSEYPHADELRHKFSITWDVLPLPASGDFRIDAENELRRTLQEQYQAAMDKRINDAMAGVWQKLKVCLEHFLDRLGEREDGKVNIFRNSLLENAHEMAVMLKDFNLTNDPEMEAARQQLLNTINGVEPDELRKNKAIREDVKANVRAMMDKFSF